jgi:hypothetical protein
LFSVRTDTRRCVYMSLLRAVRTSKSTWKQRSWAPPYLNAILLLEDMPPCLKREAQARTRITAASIRAVCALNRDPGTLFGTQNVSRDSVFVLHLLHHCRVHKNVHRRRKESSREPLQTVCFQAPLKDFTSFSAVPPTDGRHIEGSRFCITGLAAVPVPDCTI